MKDEVPMWNKIATAMANHHERMKVVRTLLENGLAVRGSKIYLNKIEVPAMKVARVADVDRRTVNETIRTIKANPELNRIFEKIASAGLSLKEVARDLGLGTVEIIVEDPLRAGIIAEASALLSQEGISIRQALVDDPELVPEPKLVLITNSQISGEVITKLRAVPGVVRVSLY